MKEFVSFLRVVSCYAVLASTAQAADLLHPLFSDHVVLQRDRAIKVWGQANAGQRVVVTLERASAQTTADANGAWSADLPAMDAGGPFTLTATSESGTTQQVADVLVGDVWLCSGQSNMALQVHRALDSYTEIANARNDSIRLLTVPMASNVRPQTQFGGPVMWQLASSASVAEFSAACWYFARELRKTANVPMGLIASAWGGSKIEAWMSEAALRASGGYEASLDILAASVTDPWSATARWGALWELWWSQKSPSEPWALQSRGDWRKAPAELGSWEEWGDARLASYDGMLWYRTQVKLSAAQAAQPSTLSLGQVDEFEQTWVNARPIGARASAMNSREERAAPVIGRGPDRTYRLPRGTLVAGENVIVVNVLDTYAKGGLRGPASSRWLRLSDGTTLALDRDWLYQIPPQFGTPPRAPWEGVAGLGVIYNSMIAPLSHFGLRGVAWYQGESNTDAPHGYGSLLTHLMADWRARFGEHLPFLIVQLANYGQPPTQPTMSGWAELREQQRLVVSKDRHAALVITTDIGDRYDIHPANKQEVGRRLARAARRIAFAGNEPPSGPRVVDARRDGSRVIVSFTDITGKLIALSADRPIGFELCAATQASCRFAAAELSDGRIALDASGAPEEVTRVRYCWADSAVCTLYDEARLPAGPFEIEVQ